MWLARVYIRKGADEESIRELGVLLDLNGIRHELKGVPENCVECYCTGSLYTTTRVLLPWFGRVIGAWHPVVHMLTSDGL
jgi:hypothetical protein